MADAESVLVAWGESDATFTGVRFCTELPATLPTKTVRIVRVGGADDTGFAKYDEATVDFDCIATTRTAARDLAGQIREAALDLVGTKPTADAFVLRVRSVSGPSWTPFDNTNFRRFTYTASIRFHWL